MAKSVLMKKIYIAGCGWMLGETFYKIFKNDYDIKCTDIDVNTNWLEYLDFRESNSYEIDVINFKADYLFHIGAFTDLEYCEKNPDETYITNVISVENAVKISNKLNIPLLFISTAGIFDGEKPFYDDWGLFNMVCGGQTSRFEVAEELVNLLGLEEKIKLIKVSSRYFDKEYFAPRPPSERLINYKLDLIKMNIMRDWRLCLKEYIQNYYIEL